MTPREEIIETVNKLFIYTDSQQWEKLKNEVFASQVRLDMISLGGEAKDTTANQICAMWQEGFKELDAVNHLGGNYLVTLKDEKTAHAFAYATATHFKESAKKGQTREFVGTYDLKLQKSAGGWRIFSFVYNLKYTQGNLSLE